MTEIFEEKLEQIKSVVTEEQLKYLHPRSVDNFLKSFKYLGTGQIQNQVIEYLNEYFIYVESKSFILTNEESNELFDNYVAKIGIIYNNRVHFKLYMRPKWALLVAIHIDLFLLLFGFLKKIYYVPIGTLLFGGYIIYLKLGFEKKNMLYGLRY